MPKADWRKLGVIDVESGICMVGDPCFLLAHEKLPKEFGPDWMAFGERVREREFSNDAAQLFFDGRRATPGLAVALHTRYGDGTYGVWGRFEGGGCLELRIKFDEYAEEEPVKPAVRTTKKKTQSSKPRVKRGRVASDG